MLWKVHFTPLIKPVPLFIPLLPKWSAGWTNSAGAVITNPGKFLASAVGSLTQPLFARGQLLGQLKITKAQQEEARLSF